MTEKHLENVKKTSANVKILSIVENRHDAHVAAKLHPSRKRGEPLMLAMLSTGLSNATDTLRRRGSSVDLKK